MLTQFNIDLLDIHANSFDGYGFSILGYGYSITRVMTSKVSRSIFGINYRKESVSNPKWAYDKWLWICLFGIGKRINIERWRPTRYDGVKYDGWYAAAKIKVKELTGEEYPESYAVEHYRHHLSPDAAAEKYSCEC